MTVFFTSDSHFGHKNILKLCNRPFGSLDEMHEAMIARWNARVRPEDVVYHLGDFSFGGVKSSVEIVKRLNGIKHLVWGNHDRHLRKSAEFLAEWAWCKDLAEVEIEGTRVVMCHFPMLSWNKSHHGSFHVHGHCHGNLAPDPNALRVDAGVDCWNFTPVSFDEIRAVMAAKSFKPVDHHGLRDEG